MNKSVGHLVIPETKNQPSKFGSNSANQVTVNCTSLHPHKPYCIGAGTSFGDVLYLDLRNKQSAPEVQAKQGSIEQTEQKLTQMTNQLYIAPTTASLEQQPSGFSVFNHNDIRTPLAGTRGFASCTSVSFHRNNPDVIISASDNGTFITHTQIESNVELIDPSQFFRNRTHVHNSGIGSVSIHPYLDVALCTTNADHVLIIQSVGK
ncbi:MAG: hypothetical protein EZS28_041542 [Streblomastix strix]|uniref:Uncharacterized protein n=1 Tax=Streblomastix strix TaxID=222440 RepID=A0A5J4TZ63_9EUKA|nr:MAG: hypothetical protein EZS28_041542 [Streblomastix strix]